MSQIKLNIKDLTGKSVKDVSVVFNLECKGLIERISDEHGNVSISGLDVGIVPITVSKNGYTSQSFVFKIDNNELSYFREIVLVSTENKEKVRDVVKETSSKLVEATTNSVVESFKFVEPKNIDEAKIWYKSFQKNINSQKEVVEKALKDGAHDILQQQASNLTYTLGQQLTASIHWYVSERSKLNPLGSLDELGKWASYTSIIGALFILRNNLVEYISKILNKLKIGI